MPVPERLLWRRLPPLYLLKSQAGQTSSLPAAPNNNGMKMKAYLIISGNVQGVSYRAHARRAAHQHHVKGFVRNLQNGTVEIFAVYEKPEQLQAFIRELDRKSESFIGIHVASIEVFRTGQMGFKDDPDAEKTPDFEIRF